MNFSEVKEVTNKYLMPTYGKFDVSIESGKGCLLYDTEGKEYLDFTSGIGVNCLGHANSAVVETIKKQADKLLHMSNLYYNSEQASLAQKLTKLSGMERAFFCNSGAEANECAIKLARKYSNDKYGENRANIVTFKSSFHGRTITTLSATGQEAMHKYFYPFTEGFDYAVLNDIEGVFETVTDKTCAVMFELIQGEGGVCPAEKDFVEKLAQFCEKKDILLIVDEVQTGIARTGTLFCFEQYDIKPDVVTLAKGLGGGVPIGAVVCSKKLKDTLSPSTHGTTFGGNPLACSVANTVLDTVSSEEFLSSVREKGEYIKSSLSKLKNVSDVRGKGLMIGFDVEGMTSAEVAKECLNKGLLVLTAKTAVRLLPPLIISTEEIDRGIAILNDVING